MFTSNPRRSAPNFSHPGGVNNVIFFPERSWVRAMSSPGKDQVTVRTENRVYFVTPTAFRTRESAVTIPSRGAGVLAEGAVAGGANANAIAAVGVARRWGRRAGRPE